MLDELKRFFLNLLGGVPREEYTETVYEKDIEYNKLLTKVEAKDYEIKRLHEEMAAMLEEYEDKEADSIPNNYAAINFTDNGEYSFSVKVTCHECILVKKGTTVTFTGYRGDKLVDKIRVSASSSDEEDKTGETQTEELKDLAELEQRLTIQEEYEDAKEKENKEV